MGIQAIVGPFEPHPALELPECWVPEMQDLERMEVTSESSQGWRQEHGD